MMSGQPSPLKSPAEATLMPNHCTVPAEKDVHAALPTLGRVEVRADDDVVVAVAVQIAGVGDRAAEDVAVELTGRIDEDLRGDRGGASVAWRGEEREGCEQNGSEGDSR